MVLGSSMLIEGFELATRKGGKDPNAVPSLSVIGKELIPGTAGSPSVWQLTYVLNYNVHTAKDLLEFTRWYNRSMEDLGLLSDGESRKMYSAYS